MGKHNKGLLTDTEQYEKGKILKQTGWLPGRDTPAEKLKKMLRKEGTNNSYSGKLEGKVVITSGKWEEKSPWYVNMFEPLFGGNKPETDYVYRGKAYDDSRHDSIRSSKSSEDNISKLHVKFHVAEGVPVSYNDLVRVRYYNTDNNFVGVVGIIEENLGKYSDWDPDQTRKNKKPGSKKIPQPIPNPSPERVPPAGKIVYPHDPTTGLPVKDVEVIRKKVTSFTGRRRTDNPDATTDHPGIDMRARYETGKIYAAMGGQVAVKKQVIDDTKTLTGYGYYVVIKTTNLVGLGPIYTIYGHLMKEVMERFPRNFGEQTIDAGAFVGISGATGTTSPIGPTGAHLHFGISYPGDGKDLSPGQAAAYHSVYVTDPLTQFFNRTFEKK